MVEINQKYPHGLPDADIERYIQGYAEEIFDKRGDINTVMWAAPMIHLGRAELQSRGIERGTRFTKLVSYSSIVVALVALAISIINSRSSSRWEERQLQLLATLERRLGSLDASTQKNARELENLAAAVERARQAVTAELAKRDAANKSLERTRGK